MSETRWVPKEGVVQRTVSEDAAALAEARLVERARIERLLLRRIAEQEKVTKGMNTMLKFDALARLHELKELLSEVESGDDAR